MPADSPLVRRATIQDASAIARLATELGYPAAGQQITDRLSVLLMDGRHAVFTAMRQDRMLGWMHVERRHALESGEKMEIIGLVVSASERRLGVGLALLRSAEHWASEQGFDTLVVRSNTARIQSHPFYRKHGFARDKTQHVYSRKF